MAFRVDILPDGQIEILRAFGNHRKFLKYGNMESALIVIRLFIKNDLAQSASNRFEPQLIKDARKAFKQLQEKSPYGTKK
jgi:hypothetical protein